MDEVYGPQGAKLAAQAWEIGKLKAEVFRLQTALADATERAEALEKERDAAIARADALAARLREVEG